METTRRLVEELLPVFAVNRTVYKALCDHHAAKHRPEGT